MPYRQTPLVTGETYHLFNRSVDHLPIFTHKRDCQRAIETLEFYLYKNSPLRFSHYDRLAAPEKTKLCLSLHRSPKQLDIYAFCLMPNHIHLLAKEETPNGIATFMRHFQNSFARYHNTKYKRHGAVFQAMFKAVRIENNEQFLHVQRYIHLNPLTSYLLKNEKELTQFPWSSYQSYLHERVSPFVNTNPILEQFSSIDQFRRFTIDQIDYQRNLHQIQHLTFE